MSLLTREEKDQKLREFGLKPTDRFLNGHRLWKTPIGYPIWVPDEDNEYPELLIEKVLRAAGQLRYHDAI